LIINISKTIKLYIKAKKEKEQKMNEK